MAKIDPLPSTMHPRPTIKQIQEAYEIADNEVACNCCLSNGVHLNVTRRSPRFDDDRNERGNWHLLCDICYSTHLGVWYEYPEQHDSDALEIMKMVAFVGNQILNRLPKP